MTTFALISDIHANLPALDAVLDDLAARSDIQGVYHLGDLVGYAPWPNEVVSRLREEGITGIADPAAAATRLRELGVRFAIVTDGPNGAWVNHDDFVGHIPAFKVDTSDTTGAGDSFTGGVLTALIHRR